MQRTKQSNIPTYILVLERDYQRGHWVKYIVQLIVQSILIREAWQRAEHSSERMARGGLSEKVA